jgi:hypothetical protein
VTAFLPKSVQPPPAAGPPTGRAPVVKVPRRVTTKALARAKGVPIEVKVARAGKIKLSGTVPARILRRKGRPVLVAKGSAAAKRAGTVTVRLRLTPAARKKPNRLKGARMTLRVSHRGHSAIKRFKLR